MTHQQPTKGAKPGERAFDNPAVAIAPQPAMIFMSPVHAIRSVRHDQRNARARESFPFRVAVVGHVPNQRRQLAQRAAPRDARNSNRVQGGRDERDFPGAGRGDMYSQRNTLTVDHHHPLRTLSPLRLADVSAPFFAAANEPSMNAFSQRSRPRASSLPRKARHRASHVPSSSHSRMRRQQVAPLGYPSGRSRQRAPVFSTQRIPSMTSRWLMRGRPPVRERRGRGRCRSIWAHCASVTRTLRLATSTSGQGSTAAPRQVQVLFTSSPRF